MAKSSARGFIMPEEQKETAGQAEGGLYSDYDRLSLLLTEAQKLAKENRNFNPAIIREYFSVLVELYNSIYPFIGKTEQTIKVKNTINALDTLTQTVYIKLLTQENYQVSYKVFGFLGKLAREIEIMRHTANLTIQKRKRYTGQKKLKISLE